MSRRPGTLADLLEFSSKLPWQLGLGLAVVSGLGFHFAAAAFSGLPTVSSTSDLGSVMVQQGIQTSVYFLQFVVPAGFVIGATVSILGRSGQSLPAAVRVNPTAALASMSWRDFERLIGDSFRQRGYTVTGFGGSGADGGVDLGLMKNGERYLVQCKLWRKDQVGVTVVRDLNGVIAAQRAHGGFVVTGGEFTREARDFARTRKIVLIDGPSLDRLIRDVSRGRPARRAIASH